MTELTFDFWQPAEPKLPKLRAPQYEGMQTLSFSSDELSGTTSDDRHFGLQTSRTQQINKRCSIATAGIDTVEEY